MHIYEFAEVTLLTLKSSQGKSGLAYYAGHPYQIPSPVPPRTACLPKDCQTLGGCWVVITSTSGVFSYSQNLLSSLDLLILPLPLAQG